MNTWYYLLDGMPFEAGVYLVLRGDELLYIGQSCRLKERLIGHNRKRDFVEAGANQIRWMAVPNRYHRLETEKFLIKRWKPPMCKRTGFPAHRKPNPVYELQ